MNDLDYIDEMRAEFEKTQKENNQKPKIIEFLLFLNIDMESICDEDQNSGIQILTDDGINYYGKLLNDMIQKAAGKNLSVYEKEIISKIDPSIFKPKPIKANYPIQCEGDPRFDIFLIKTIKESSKYIIPKYRKHVTVATAAIPVGVFMDNLYITDDDYTFNEILEYRVPMSYMDPSLA